MFVIARELSEMTTFPQFPFVFHRPKRRSCAQGLVLAWMMGAHAWAAQETVQTVAVRVTAPALAYRQFDKVELTGSSILSSRSKAPLPVLVYERKDLARIPAQTTAELVQALTSQINGFILGSVAAGVLEAGPQSAAIHGLQDATLVLLNGRRLPDYSRPVLGVDRNATDLDVVPLQAIERIEVMNDGASARYGSDAIAGVINLITTERLEGARVGAQMNVPTASSGRSERAYVSIGRGDFRTDGWDWQLHGSISHHEGLRTTDREALRRVPSVGDPADGVYYAANFFDLSRYAWPASTAPVLSSWGTVAAGTLEPQTSMVNGQCAPGMVPILFGGETSCWTQKAYGLSVEPEQRRLQLLASGRVALTPHWAAFAELAWSQKTLSSAAVSAGEQAWFQSLGFGRWAFAAPYPLGPSKQQYAYDQYRLTAGVKGDWEGWETQTSAAVGVQKSVFKESGPRVKLAGSPSYADLGLTEAVLSTPADQLSEDTLAMLSQGVRFDGVPRDQGETSIQTLQAMASKVVAQNDNGDVSLGVGLQWRREALRTDTYDKTAATLYTPADPTVSPSLRGSREVQALFGELVYPLSPYWTLDAQARHDAYSDVGQVSTGKLALRWQPNRQWTLRGSMGTGFRAPDLTQVSSQSAYLGQGSTAVNDPFLGQSFIRSYQNAGNSDLKPELSMQQTLGARFDPSPRWTLGGDYWRVHMRDQIVVPTVQSVQDSRYWYDQLIEHLADGTQRFTYRPYNLGESWREGIDYELQYRHPTAWGRWRVVWKGTHYLRAASQRSPGEDKVSILGVAYGANYEYVPKDKFTLMLALERPTWAAWLQGNYLSGNREHYNVWNANAGERGVDPVQRTREVPAYWTLDAGWRWQPTPQHRFDLRIVNLLNQYPPFRALGYPLLRPGVDLRYGDYNGRTLQFQYEYQF